MKPKYIIILVLGIAAGIVVFMNLQKSSSQTVLSTSNNSGTKQTAQNPDQNSNLPSSQTASAPTPTPTQNQPVPSNTTNQTLSYTTQDQLLAMAGNKYANGILPLGDYKYQTTGAQKGYVYLCRAQTGGGGAQTNGDWITGNTWDINKKISVQGSIPWPQASVNIKISGSTRTITTNDLPTNHNSGTFPVASTDPAYQIDRNPNTITAQNLSFSLPANPSQTSQPNCIGGEVGVMTNGVLLFNAFDAEGRDAAAHEVQDSCDAHPQESGEYHYHSLSACFKMPLVTQVIGYAFDGFPITGPTVANGKYLTTENLDECHGLTSEIMQDGKKTVSYHYVMTQDFPYSVGCFKAKSTLSGPLAQPAGNGQTSQQPAQQGNGQQPPQQAISACSGKTSGTSCSFTTPMGDSITGSCQTPPNSSLACVPTNPPQ